MENALIGQKGTFEVKNICVVGTMNLNEDYKQLEEWTELKCSEIVFDSNVDNWDKNTSVLNERIIGKKQVAFVI